MNLAMIYVYENFNTGILYLFLPDNDTQHDVLLIIFDLNLRIYNIRLFF